MKRIICILLSLLCFLPSIPVCAAADKNNDEMVYAGESEREAIYHEMQAEEFDRRNGFTEWHYHVDKYSITPLYKLDLLECAQTGEVSIGRAAMEDDPDALLYAAKTVTDDGNFAGNMTFSVKNGKIIYTTIQMTDRLPGYEGDSYPASCSYADHAERIRTILGLDTAPSVYDVKYVKIMADGQYFCVNTPSGKYFIPEGAVSSGSKEAVLTVKISESEMKSIAKDYQAEYNIALKDLENWKKDHPGETPYMNTDIAAPDMSKFVTENGVKARVDNVTDTEGFIRRNLEASTPLSEKAPVDGRKKTVVWIIVGAGAALLFAAAAAFVIVRKKKTRAA